MSYQAKILQDGLDEPWQDENRFVVSQKLKRVIDLVLAIVIIVLLAPLLGALFALTRLDGGPSLFRHERIGAAGRTFRCLKFRTMVQNSDIALITLFARDPNAAEEWRETQKLTNDPRVTLVGGFLRRTSLDELPQLFNVVLNDMSLVGPRPITTNEVTRYGPYIRFYHAVQPGITGLWQVSGRSNTSYERRVALDVSYVRQWSVWADMVILVKTVPVVLLRQGAH